MTVEKFADAIINSDRMKIISQGQEIYVGFLAKLRTMDIFEQIRNKKIALFRAVPEIRHKSWKELELIPPIEPEQMPEYSFSDLRMTLYYTLYI